MRKRIVIIGSNVAGFATALELKQRLGAAHDITVLSQSAEFVFMPSLIWLPFGERKPADIMFALAPVYAAKDIHFVQTHVEMIDLEGQTVHYRVGKIDYDYLVIATGLGNDWGAIEGLGPWEGYTESIFGLADAEHAAAAFERFVTKPGPVVIGAVQGASSFGAAYEFLFNFAYQLRKRAINVPITFVTAEPYLGHLGIGGLGASRKLIDGFFEHERMYALTNASIAEVRAKEISLVDGRRMPFEFAMLAPAFVGVQVVRACSEIVDGRGFVEVSDTYQTARYLNVYAAGVAVAIAPPEPTTVPCAVPKTGYMSEAMARIVAHNIAADINEQPKQRCAPGAIETRSILDAGDDGLIIVADHLLAPREHAWLIPGPEAHWAKVAYEKMFLTTHQRGWVSGGFVPGIGHATK